MAVIKQTNPNKYKPIFGVVCLVDALGAKNYTDEETINFLQSRVVIKKAIDDKISDQVESGSINQAQIAVFNDTIIIAIECEENGNDEYNTIKAMGIIVRKLISDGISKSILFRGSIGIGKYYLDLSYDTVIGQAVTDAANWYEEPDFLGCILTPRLALTLKKHQCEYKKPATNIFVEYDVPLKDGKHEMICVNWPKAFFVDSIRPKGCTAGNETKYLHEKLSKNSIPKNTEHKYYNTIKFFKDCTKNYIK